MTWAKGRCSSTEPPRGAPKSVFMYSPDVWQSGNPHAVSEGIGQANFSVFCSTWVSRTCNCRTARSTESLLIAASWVQAGGWGGGTMVAGKLSHSFHSGHSVLTLLWGLLLVSVAGALVSSINRNLIFQEVLLWKNKNSCDEAVNLVTK